jgi:septal ring factor EnvC (AmiA/AmiB activator)
VGKKNNSFFRFLAHLFIMATILSLAVGATACKDKKIKKDDQTAQQNSLRDELRRNKQEIESTMTKINQEINKAEGALQSLKSAAKECQMELNKIKKEEGIETYQQAVNSQKANNRLQCIAANQGYIDYINQYIFESKSSNENLLSVKRQLDAGITASEVLNNEGNLQNLRETLKEFSQRYGKNQGNEIMPKFTNLPAEDLEKLKQQSWEKIQEQTKNQQQINRDAVTGPPHLVPHGSGSSGPPIPQRTADSLE